MGRKQNDVFVLGEESLLAEAIEARDSGSAALEDGENPTAELASLGSSASVGAIPGRASAPRRLAVFGLGAGAAALTAGLVISAKTGSQDAPSQSQTSSARRSPSAVVGGSAAPPVPARSRRLLDPRPRPKRPRRQPRSRGEPQRETTTDSAPISSPVDVVAVAVDPPPTPASPSLPERAVAAERRRRFGEEGGVHLRAVAMGARATEALGVTARRVGHGWEEARRARYAALAPRYLATVVLFVFVALGVRAMFFAPQPPPLPRAACRKRMRPVRTSPCSSPAPISATTPRVPAPRTRALAPFLPERPRPRRRLLRGLWRASRCAGRRSPPTSGRWPAAG